MDTFINNTSILITKFKSLKYIFTIHLTILIIFLSTTIIYYYFSYSILMFPLILYSLSHIYLILLVRCLY